MQKNRQDEKRQKKRHQEAYLEGDSKNLPYKWDVILQMSKNKKDSIKKKKRFGNILMFVLSCVITICFLLTNSVVFSTDPIKVGSVSPKRYVAERTVENQKSVSLYSFSCRRFIFLGFCSVY